jgi:hypothetical protein
MDAMTIYYGEIAMLLHLGQYLSDEVLLETCRNSTIVTVKEMIDKGMDEIQVVECCEKCVRLLISIGHSQAIRLEKLMAKDLASMN